MAPMSCTQFTLAKISPHYISSLGVPQQQILWIGCSDSGFEETESLDLLPDEMIVIRNIGNIVLDDDTSCASVMQYAVEMLKVRHIIICGHYGCGIINTGASDGLKEPWLSNLDSLRSASQFDLRNAISLDVRDRRLVELNVAKQMLFVRELAIVRAAVQDRGLEIHGLVYDRPNDVTFEVVGVLSGK